MFVSIFQFPVCINYKMPDSSNSHQSAVCSEIMSNNNSSGDSGKKSNTVQIDLGEVTQHNIKVLKKVNQVSYKLK